MFSVIYSFKVKEGREKEFIDAWKGLTHLIYEHEGSYGSRLHKSDEHTFIAYASWPDKATWENSGTNLPESANTFRESMRNSCDDIQTDHQLEVIEDLLKSSPSQ